MRVTRAGCAIVGVSLVACRVAAATDLDPAEAALESALTDKLVEASRAGKAPWLVLQPDSAQPGPICTDRWQYVIAPALSRARTPSARAALLSSFASFNLYGGEPGPVLVELARDPDRELRLWALRIVGYSAATVGSAADAVRAGLADPDRRVQVVAAGALRSTYQGMPPEMVAALGKRLEDADQEIRRAVLDGLGNAKDLTPALDGLLAVLADPDADLPSRRRVAVLLGRTGSARAVAPLAALMDDARPETRRAAAEGLAGLAKRGRPAGLRGPLEKAELDLDRETKVAGAAGLAALGQLDVGLPTLRRMLFSTDSGARGEAMAALEELGKTAAPAAPDLMRLALEPDERSRNGHSKHGQFRQEEAIRILTKLGPPGIAAMLHELRPPPPAPRHRHRQPHRAAPDDDDGGDDDDDDLLGGDDGRRDERGMVIYLLGEVGLANPAAFQAVAKLAADRDQHLRAAVARDLGKIAPDKAAAARVIATLVRDRNLDVRRSAVEGLRQLGPAAAPASGAVAAALADKDTPLAEAAADALAAIGKGAAGPARGALTKAAKDARAEVRGAVGHALVTTGVDPKRGLAMLVEAFDAAPALMNRNYPNQEPRRDAGWRLQAVASRPDAAEIILPAAVRGLKSADWGKQARAATLLDELGDRAAGAAPAMVEALGDEKQYFNTDRAAALCHAIASLPSVTLDQTGAMVTLIKRTRNEACSKALSIAVKRVPELAEKLKQNFKGECPYPYGAANAAFKAPATP